MRVVKLPPVSRQARVREYTPAPAPGPVQRKPCSGCGKIAEASAEIATEFGAELVERWRARESARIVSGR